MAKIRLEINGRPYDMVAEDGQEGRVIQLGQDMAKRVKNIAHQVGQVGEGRLILMAALQLADEMQALQARIEQLETLSKNAAAHQNTVQQARDYMTTVYGDLADKFETLAEQL